MKYIGVSQTSSGKWRARIRNNGIKKSLGLFSTAEEAALAYDCVAKKIRKKGTYTLNFTETGAGRSYNGRRCSSKYEGVHFDYRLRKYRPTLSVNGKQIRGAYYIKEKDAAKAHDDMVRKYGTDHKIHFPIVTFSATKMVRAELSVSFLYTIK